MFEKMPSDLVQVAWGFVVTWAFAGLGRLLWHIQEVQRGHRQFFSIWLVWELGTALATGFIAVGVAEYLGFSGNVAIAVVIIVSYLGPRGIEALLERVLSKHIPPKQ